MTQVTVIIWVCAYTDNSYICVAEASAPETRRSGRSVSMITEPSADCARSKNSRRIPRVISSASVSNTLRKTLITMCCSHGRMGCSASRGRFIRRQKDLKWKQRTADGWVRCSKPDFDAEELTYNDSHRQNYQEQQEQVELGTFNHGQRISHYVPDSDEKYELDTRQ